MSTTIVAIETIREISSYEQLSEQIHVAGKIAMQYGVFVQPIKLDQDIADACTGFVDVIETRLQEAGKRSQYENHFFADLLASSIVGWPAIRAQYDPFVTAIENGLQTIAPLVRRNNSLCLERGLAVNKTYPLCSGAPMHVDAGVDISIGVMPNEFTAELASSYRYWPWLRNKSQASTVHLSAAIVGMRGPGRFRKSPRAVYHSFANPNDTLPRHSVIGVLRPVI